jgi:hypothetical protein
MPFQDCEFIRSAFPLQPVNAFTALALVAAGCFLTIRYRRRGSFLYGTTLIAVGGTSFLFHAFGIDGESIAVILLASWTATWILLGSNAKAIRTWVLFGIGAAALISFLPTIRHAITALAITAVAIGLTLDPVLRRELAWLVIAAPVALGVYTLGRTGGPWCRPESFVQVHAVWHLIAASVLGLIGDRLSRHFDRIDHGRLSSNRSDRISRARRISSLRRP